jgi:repressor LexA
MQDVIKELADTKQQLESFKDKYYCLLNANEERKQDNYRLKRENSYLRTKNYELTMLINTFLNIKKGSVKVQKLTETQEQIYLSIKEYITKNKISPSVRELCEINNLSAPATMKYHLKNLKNKGYITYRDKTPRSIVILGE